MANRKYKIRWLFVNTMDVIGNSTLKKQKIFRLDKNIQNWNIFCL